MQISDIPVPQVVEELVEVVTLSPRTGLARREQGQSCEAQNHRDDGAETTRHPGKINHQDGLSRSVTITTNTKIMKW